MLTTIILNKSLKILLRWREKSLTTIKLSYIHATKVICCHKNPICLQVVFPSLMIIRSQTKSSLFLAQALNPKSNNARRDPYGPLAY